MAPSVPLPTAATKTLGVSQSICSALPSKNDWILTKSLMKSLEEFHSFENKEETEKRVQVLKSLNLIVMKWIQEITDERLPEGMSGGGKLMTFGSYRLGVHSSGGDIDTVLVAPKHVTRSDFFSTLKDILMENPNVKNMNAVEKAFVPLMTFEYSGIEIDLLFAQMNMTTVPENLDLTDDSLLKNLDQESVRSLNGVRVAERLFNLVPNQNTFCITLRAIKIWAKNHGIYSNAMGFFGGISWAILVARTCQLYPNATPSKMIQKVFFVFSTWKWPSPVILDFLSHERSEMGSLNYLVWGKAHADKFHFMPILTPAFPEQNSTHNVSISTMSVIQEEMKMALETCNQIYKGAATWKDLLEEMNFFSKYKHFVAIKMDLEDNKVFEGFLESRLRQLILILERNGGVKTAQINPKKIQSKWFVGLEFHENVKSLDLTKDIEMFKTSIQNQVVSLKNVKSTDMDVLYTKRSNLIKILPAEDLKRGKFYGSTGVKENAESRKRKCIDSIAEPEAKRKILGSVNK
uniref:Poly(A) polymerase n=2 Tax=Caenorhabditis tropicalis TaxID=1561998 RepID=A0A1I7UC86_9PELO